MESTKDLNYYKNNCEEDYINTPMSVLRYITELEHALQLQQTGVSSSLLSDEEIKGAADEWVFDKNGMKWSNNDNTAGDNYGSFMAGVKRALIRLCNDR